VGHHLQFSPRLAEVPTREMLVRRAAPEKSHQEDEHHDSDPNGEDDGYRPGGPLRKGATLLHERKALLARSGRKGPGSGVGGIGRGGFLDDRFGAPTTVIFPLEGDS